MTLRSPTLADIQLGDELPELRVPLTTSLIVAGALASRDFTRVHHDKAAAQATGMQDVFMNILTTEGWVVALRHRLGRSRRADPQALDQARRAQPAGRHDEDDGHGASEAGRERRGRGRGQEHLGRSRDGPVDAVAAP